MYTYTGFQDFDFLCVFIWVNVCGWSHGAEISVTLKCDSYNFLGSFSKDDGDAEDDALQKQKKWIYIFPSSVASVYVNSSSL